MNEINHILYNYYVTSNDNYIQNINKHRFVSKIDRKTETILFK